MARTHAGPRGDQAWQRGHSATQCCPAAQQAPSGEAQGARCCCQCWVLRGGHVDTPTLRQQTEPQPLGRPGGGTEDERTPREPTGGVGKSASGAHTHTSAYSNWTRHQRRNCLQGLQKRLCHLAMATTINFTGKVLKIKLFK